MNLDPGPRDGDTAMLLYAEDVISTSCSSPSFCLLILTTLAHNSRLIFTPYPPVTSPFYADPHPQP